MGGMFKPATRQKLKLRMAICSPAGYGKSYTGLIFAGALAAADGNGKPLAIAAIDTEHGALRKYAGSALVNGQAAAFDVCELSHFAPTTYTTAIREAAAAGYGVLLIDSLSHAWAGVGGALDQVDKKAGSGGNSFTAWKDVTPQHQELIEAILAFPGHVIATMRTKMEYVLEEETRSNGKKVVVPKRVGMKPVQREGMDYEFDVVADMDEAHTLIVGKTRCPAIDGQRVVKPGPEFLAPVIRWLNEGETPAAVVAHAFSPAVATEATSTPPATTTTTPAAPATSTTAATTPRMASDVQCSEIAVHCQTLSLKGQPAAMLAKRGVSKLEELTHAQAEEILVTLRKKTADAKAAGEMALGQQERADAKAAAEKAKAANAPTAHSAAASETVKDDPNTTPAVDPNRVGTITDGDQALILDYCKRLNIDNATLGKILAKRKTTQGNPVACIPDLSANQAAEILENLRKKCQEMFGNDIPF